MLKGRLILGITIIALALVMVMISPLASADKDNVDKSNYDDKKSKSHDDDQSNTVSSNTVLIEQLKNEIIKEIMIQLTPPATTDPKSSSDSSPTAIYTHLDVATCTIDPTTNLPYGWCPDGSTVTFFIHDSHVTKYSVISVTTVPPTNNPLSIIQCSEDAIFYGIGANAGFAIACNGSPMAGTGLNYIVFNPSQSWIDAHTIK